MAKQRLRCLLCTGLYKAAEETYAGLSSDAAAKAEFGEKMAALPAKAKAAAAKLADVTGSTAYTKFAAYFAAGEGAVMVRDGGSVHLETLTAADAELTGTALDTYASVAKMLYEQGEYAQADVILRNYLSVVRGADGPSLSALWGKLACSIALGKWSNAASDLGLVKQAAESKNVAPVVQLQHRGWIVHWGLLIQFGTSADENMPDVFGDRFNLQCIENTCPWVLRYYTASVILQNRRKNVTNDLLREIRHMKYQYSDCFTEFMESLWEQFDFRGAQMKLKQCCETIEKDYFLSAFKDKFMQQSRLLVCEVYCQLNRTVELSTLADKLELTEEETEVWMVDMVRNASVASVSNARVDSSCKQVLMSAPTRSGRVSVADASRDLTVRSGLLTNQLEKLMANQHVYVAATKQ